MTRVGSRISQIGGSQGLNEGWRKAIILPKNPENPEKFGLGFQPSSGFISGKLSFCCKKRKASCFLSTVALRIKFPY